MAEGPVSGLGAQQIATHEKHEAEAKPASIYQTAAAAQNAQGGLGGMVHHEAPMKIYGVDQRDKEMEVRLGLNQLAGQGLLPQMISDNKDVASWVMEKTKIEEANQFINNILTFYDQTNLAEKREFDRKFPWIKEMKLKRIREVAAMHLRLAELMENSDPSVDDVKYIIDLLQGKAALPPQLLPDQIHNNLRPRGEDASTYPFIEGMFNPFKFTNPIDARNRNVVVQALGTNVLGRGFIERWQQGVTATGPTNLREWTEYFVRKAAQGANSTSAIQWAGNTQGF
jgi:hypothetical protein